MSSFFAGLEPERVWYHFEAITKLPHGPGNEDGVRRYIADFAQKLGLEYYYHPEALPTNYGERVMVVYKKAAPGFENKPTVVLQGHLDMVCVPNEQIFPLKLHFCDSWGKPGTGWVKAGGYTEHDGTTLGADNGIGAALILAILEDTCHSFGPIEAFFTVKEETGMDGAREFDPALLKGRVFINLDEEELRTITYGCAGGLRSNLQWNIRRVPVPTGTRGFTLKISGLKGGHSGASIHLGRANAIQLAARILERASREKIGFNISDFSSGNLSQSNVIPGNAQVSLIVNAGDDERFAQLVSEMTGTFREQYQKIEDNLQIEWQEMKPPAEMIDLEGTHKIIDILMKIPHGVTKMAAEKSDVVETSTNLAAIAMNGEEFKIVCMHRSSLESGLDLMKDLHQDIAGSSNGRISFSERYPAWSPNEDSGLLQKVKQVYTKQFQGKFETQIIHAGLECGWVVHKYQQDNPMDCIAIGPTIVDPHSRNERLEIDSVAAIYDCILEILRLYSQ